MGCARAALTGILLVGLVQANDEESNNAKIGVKLLVAIAVVACAEIAAAKERKGEGARPQLVNAAGALALVNVPSPCSGPPPADPGSRVGWGQGMRSSLPWVRRPSRSS